MIPQLAEEQREDLQHPHAYVAELPDRPPIQVIRELSRLDQFQAAREPNFA
jgi:hypothetical protein